MFGKNFSDEYSSEIFSRKFVNSRAKVNHLIKSVYKDNARSMTILDQWKLSDKIHRNTFPTTTWNIKRLKKSCELLSRNFNPLTYVTVNHI